MYVTDDRSDEPLADRAPGGRPLASRPSAGQLVGGMLANVEAVVTGRPAPRPQIEEPYRDEWASLDGVRIDGLDERPDRPEPPDRSGARL